MNGRSRDIINQLKIENKILTAENRYMKAANSRTQCSSDMDVDVAELWHDFRRLKTAKVEECNSLKKKLRMAIAALIMSWCIFLSVCMLV